MKRSLRAIVAASFIVGGTIGSGLQAQVSVTWGGGDGRWEEPNWTKDGIPGQTAVAAMGDNTGGRGGVDIVIGGGAFVEFDHNRSDTLLGDYNDNERVDAADYVQWRKGGPLENEVDNPGTVNGGDYSAWRARFGNAALGDFKPRMDLNGPGSMTVKEGATLYMDSHSDDDGRWSRIGISMTFDNGTWRRTHSAPSQSGGKIIFGYHSELAANEKIEFNVINGGRIENDGKIIFGEADYFVSQGGDNNGHSDGIEVAVTIDNGTLDLTGGGYPDYPTGLVSGEMVFVYEYHEGVGPRNEKYSINFTGPGSITVDPHLDEFLQYKGGIYVAQQDSSGAYSALGGATNLVTPIGYEDLWDLGILQANGQSGMTGATFSDFFTTTGDQFHEDYTLTSLIPDGSGAGLGTGGAVPEPASSLLFWLGLTGVLLRRRSTNAVLAQPALAQKRSKISERRNFYLTSSSGVLG